MEYDDLTELRPEQLPAPKCGRWYTAEDGEQIAITRATVDEQHISIKGAGYGSGGAIPDEVVRWDDFTALNEDDQFAVVASRLGIEPPETFRKAIITTAEAFTRPFDETLGQYVYENFRDELPLPQTYKQHLPLDSDDRIRRGELDVDVPTDELEPGVFFTRDGNITAFGDLNENDYRTNIRLHPLSIQLVDVRDHRILPSDIDDAIGHAAARPIGGYWSQALSDYIAEFVDNVDEWRYIAENGEQRY